MKKCQKTILKTFILFAILCSGTIISYSNLQQNSNMIEKSTSSKSNELINVIDFDQFDEQLDLLIENSTLEILIYNLIDSRHNLVILKITLFDWLPPEVS